MSVKRGFPVQGPKIKVYRSLGCSDSVVQILVWEFYHNENRNMNASLSEKAWRFLHVNVLKLIPLLGLFLGCLKKGMTPVFFFFPEYSSNDFASFKASTSSTYLLTTRCTVLLWANLVGGLVRQSYSVMRLLKEKKTAQPHSPHY